MEGSGELIVTFIDGVEEACVVDGFLLGVLFVLTPVGTVGSEPKDSFDVGFVEVDENVDLETRGGVLSLETREVLYLLVELLVGSVGVAGVETMDEVVPFPVKELDKNEIGILVEL